MKVLFVCPFVPWPLETGGKIRTFNLIKQASAHAQVHLRVIREPDPVEDAEAALAPWCSSLAFFERRPPGPLRRWMRPKLERWFHAPTLVTQLRRELADGSFHLVHLDEPLLARILPPGRSVPVVQHHHKLDTVLYDTLRADEGVQRHFDLWKLRRLEAESTRRYRHHILCSQEDAELLRQRYGALDAAVIPSGFDPAFHRPSDPIPARDPLRLLFLGSMNYGPNVDAVTHFVDDILPRIHARHPRANFEIVGSEPADQVRALASERVTITGRVPDVRPYLERAAMLVVPLRIGGGTRLKIVEALAMGTPVVSTNVGAEGLGLADRRHLALADDSATFAARVCELLEAPAQAAAMGQRGLEQVRERYSWETLAEGLVDYWERVKFSGLSTASR